MKTKAEIVNLVELNEAEAAHLNATHNQVIETELRDEGLLLKLALEPESEPEPAPDEKA